MRLIERSLRVLRMQAEFEVIEVAGEHARAAERLGAAQRRASHAREAGETTAVQLRAEMGRPQINPAVVAVLRSVHRQQVEWLRLTEGALQAASENERMWRDTLGQHRHRERALDKACRTERTRERQQRDVQEFLRLDDQWLTSRKGAAHGAVA